MAEIENLKIGTNGTIHIVGNENIITEEWEASKTYVKDKSYVIREHKLYVCNVTHTSTSPFDPTKWTEITVIGAIDNALDMTDTASGAIATFESEYALPLRDLEIEINAVQAAGTPTPADPKAITGFTGANIHVADNENPHIIDNVTAITWNDEAGTVYGAKSKPIVGELAVTYGILDLGSKTWSYNSGGQGRWSCGGINTVVKKPSTQAIVANITCTHYESKTAQNIYGGQLGIAINTDGNIWLHDSTYDGYTPANFQNAMSGVKLVYELATPVTYQLTPTQINTIVGTNNIFTDTNGDTSLEYYTKRGEQTVRIAEGVAVDVINNKSIDTLATTNKTVVGAVNELDSDKADKTLINDIIKVKYFSLLATNVTKDMDISSNLVIDSGYKFLCYAPNVVPDGFTTDQYIWMSAPHSTQGNPWWATDPIAGAGTSGKLRFYYYEIRDI